MNPQRPLVGISAGDPAGVGPEITAKALRLPHIFESCRPLVICDAGVMKQIVEICNLELMINEVEEPQLGKFQPGTMDVLDMKNIDTEKFRFNQVAAMTGKASYQYVEKVIQLALHAKIDATVTGPIHKEALKAGGYDYAGHTEIYAKLTNTSKYSMMLAEGNFRVVHVSTHLSLLEAIARVKKERVKEVIHLANEALQRMGIVSPRIAVAGLNPHAGENGLFGQEEIDEIIPAIAGAQNEGLQVEGPFPPDTIFPKMKGGQYDVVVCMYHDQGHIPTKLLGFEYDHNSQQWKGLSGVNITLGLPIIRVSVDHGVAFDKGGLCQANPQSMIQAIQYAAGFCGTKTAVS